jgi:hypothetical protein
MKPSFRVLTSILLLSAVFTQCDFPPEPPLKVGQQIMKEPVVIIDSARSLLPLKPGNKWSYIVVPKQGQVQLPLYISSTEIMFQGEVYYELRYIYFNTPTPTYAFPPLLQTTRRGIVFFERGMPQDTIILSRPPRQMFHLPYPEAVGTTVKDPKSEWIVTVTAKDTLIAVYNSSTTYRCYRYDIQHGNNTQSRGTLYVIPGSAILRVDFDGYTFHTISWRID